MILPTQHFLMTLLILIALLSFDAHGEFTVHFSSGQPKQIYKNAQPTAMTQLNIAIDIRTDVPGISSEIGYQFICHPDDFKNKMIESTGTMSTQLSYNLMPVQPLSFQYWPKTATQGRLCQLQWAAYTIGYKNLQTNTQPYFSFGNTKLLQRKVNTEHPPLNRQNSPKKADFMMIKSSQSDR